MVSTGCIDRVPRGLSFDVQRCTSYHPAMTRPMVRVPRQLLLDTGIPAPSRIVALAMYLEVGRAGFVSMNAIRLANLCDLHPNSIRRHWDILIECGYIVRVDADPKRDESARGLLRGHLLAIQPNGKVSVEFGEKQIGSVCFAREYNPKKSSGRSRR